MFKQVETREEKELAVALAISSGIQNIVTGIDLLHLLRDGRGHHQKMLCSQSRKLSLKPEMELFARMEME